ncbi:MAG: class C sortase [Lachnospira sp.]
MRKHLINILLVIIILAGFAIILYPSFSNWWNDSRTSRVISSYQDEIKDIDQEKIDAMFEEADEYNRRLAECEDQYSEYKRAGNYDEVMNIADGVIGYISIPVIQVEYPIYHGTSDDVLNVAVGHIEGSSIPVGGESTHSVLSAHRGLPSAKLFSDLDKMEIGDIFTINILDRVMTYQVEEIIIINPNELEELEVIPGKDYVTLLTCTPYGINSHRLLLRSKRIDNEGVADATVIRTDASKVDSLIVTPFVLGLLLLFLFGYWWLIGVVFAKKKNEYWYIPYKRVESWDERKKD